MNKAPTVCQALSGAVDKMTRHFLYSYGTYITVGESGV